MQALTSYLPLGKATNKWQFQLQGLMCKFKSMIISEHFYFALFNIYVQFKS